MKKQTTKTVKASQNTAGGKKAQGVGGSEELSLTVTLSGWSAMTFRIMCEEDILTPTEWLRKQINGELVSFLEACGEYWKKEGTPGKFDVKTGRLVRGIEVQ